MGFLKKAFSGLQNAVLGVYDLNRRMLISVAEDMNVTKKKSLIGKVSLTKVQKKQIDEFFLRHYGKKIPYHWHRLYASYTGTVRHDYFPEKLFSTKLEPALNPRYIIAEQFGDKNLLVPFFARVSDVKIPTTYFSCVNGVFRDGENSLVSLDEVIEGCANLYTVIKKTIGSSSGKDVQLCHFHDGVDEKTGASAAEIVRAFGDNFVVQEPIKQHATLANLYPNSLNTFRVMTYICDGKISHCPIALRLGRNSADRDNIHYGGIVVGVDGNGCLREKAFSEYGESFEKHPDTGIVFSQVILEFYENLKEQTRRLHEQMPWLKIASWDVSVGEDGCVVLIEVNTIGQSSWFPQMVNGEPLFGEDTPKMLALIGKKKKR
ncbi:MAG: hypothetical protein IJ009_03455 [Clostridia bacterium]|nr:hypothetical protein [Clostridia bacterium]